MVDETPRELAIASVRERLASMAAGFVAQPPQDPEQQLIHATDTRRARGALERALAALPEIEREVVHAIYWGAKTLDEIGKQFGFDPKTAYRIHDRALPKIAKEMIAEGLGAPMKLGG
jgi:RNA polymerase sigma factor (sigma-70 family)